MNKTDIKIAVLIVAGGCGERMHAHIPKQYLRINDQTILRHTLEKFKDFDAIQCVIGEGHDALYQQAVDGLKLLPIVYGGATRQESVYRGLKALQSFSPDYVLIHDAARPCINPQDINNIINRLEENVNVTLASPITESLQQDGQTIERENLWLVQTPQAFDYQMILKAHEKAEKENFVGTDDTSIAMHHGHEVSYVENGKHNIKITTQNDLEMANMMINNSIETRVGMGFDVHAFDTTETKMIRLCGIDIPYNRKLKGHSDADVGLHAITDAILGAIAQGDIGTHFPPSDEKFKNMDSHVFLDKSVDILKAHGGSLTHIDLTFMCEEPKIGRRREEMVTHLASHLNLSTNRISIKATTTEKLGFTGRGEGIACQAVVTVKVPSYD